MTRPPKTVLRYSWIVRGVVLWVAIALAASACSSGRKPGGQKVPDPEPQAEKPPQRASWPAPPSEQRPGDPQRGRRALLNENYIGCGVPDSVLSRFNPFSPTPMADRDPQNADLPFFLTRYKTSDGVSVVTANCLGCHAAYMNGELVVGLGNVVSDFSMDPSGPLSMLTRLTGGVEGRELELLSSRVEALYPGVLMETLGPNPADHIAAMLFAHRDAKTLAWSDEPLMELPAHSPTPVDVPAWWMMRKKNAMFYTAAGRGDHARIMMTASALCTDSVAQAKAIDAYFPDIRAYIASLEAPPYPFEIERPSADRGQSVFEKRCSRCHGTYAEDNADDAYPNLVVALEVVGTDPVLAVGSGQFAGRFVEWFNRSFYGEIANLDPQPGYIAPPLDGVWATAPYFHNGSVATLAEVLDSSARPKRWRRLSLSSRDYDKKRLGWRSTQVDDEEWAETDDRRMIYDTTRLGYSNVGHPFGDSLTPVARRDLLEYLKTL